MSRLARFEAQFSQSGIRLEVFVQKKIAEHGDPPRCKSVDQFVKSFGEHEKIREMIVYVARLQR